MCLLCTGTLLTAALLMRAINRKQYHTEALAHLESPKKCDAMRIGYYSDLADKWSIEYQLEQWITSLHSGTMITCDLSNLNLISLHYEQYLCVAHAIDISGNPLNNNRLAQRNLAALRKCNVCLVPDNGTISDVNE